MKYVWIYVNTNKEVGDPEHLQVFADEAAAEAWFRDHDPEGAAFEYPVKADPRTWPLLGDDTDHKAPGRAADRQF